MASDAGQQQATGVPEMLTVPGGSGRCAGTGVEASKGITVKATIPTCNYAV